MILLLFSALLSVAAPGKTAVVHSLNGTWQFMLARDAGQVARLEQLFHTPGFDVSAFRPIGVPANWALERQTGAHRS